MKAKLKILYTIPNFDTAGSGKVLYDLAKGLNAEQFEVSIACKNNKGVFFKEIEALGLPIYFMDPTVSLKPYYNLITRVHKFKNFIKKNNFDIIHSWHWSSDWTEALAARFARKPWIYTKKAMGFKSKHWYIRSYLAHFIITINNEMHFYFPYKKAQALIPLGIDTEFYSSEHFNLLKEKDSLKFNIITVANLVPVKGIEVLIRAIYGLQDKTIMLNILGDNENTYGKEIEALIDYLNLKQQIKFLGKKLDVRQDISQADLFVIPTLNGGRKEGMPMALVEAMSMGIPVLGSNISGINFVLKDFQEFLFEASNAKQLGEKIKLFNDKTIEERNAIGQELRNYCITYFSLNKFIRAHENLYLKIIEKKLND